MAGSCRRSAWKSALQTSLTWALLSMFLLYTEIAAGSLSAAYTMSKPSSWNPRSRPPQPQKRLTTVSFFPPSESRTLRVSSGFGGGVLNLSRRLVIAVCWLAGERPQGTALAGEEVPATIVLSGLKVPSDRLPQPAAVPSLAALITGNCNTHSASASVGVSVLIERRGGLPCSAEVEEEASAVFGRRRGTRSRTRQPGPVLTRPPLNGAELKSKAAEPPNRPLNPPQPPNHKPATPPSPPRCPAPPAGCRQRCRRRSAQQCCG